MLRTSKKEIENEIKVGRINEISDALVDYCMYRCRYVACSRGRHELTGVVLVDCGGMLFATTSKAILEKLF